MGDIVEGAYKEFQDLIGCLAPGQLSEMSWINRHFAKVLVLTIASYFESEIIKIIYDCANSGCCDKKIPELIKKTIDSFEYNKLFDWKARNANKLFSFFGQDFQSQTTKKVEELESVKNGMVVFMELGAERNKMVHSNFGSFPLSETPDEIYEKYKKAIEFVKFLKDSLNKEPQDTAEPQEAS